MWKSKSVGVMMTLTTDAMQFKEPESPLCMEAGGVWLVYSSGSNPDELGLRQTAAKLGNVLRKWLF